MGNDNSGSESAISLPKGGGAIKGIGETFQPNLFTGTGNFSVTIATSPGRNGFGPELTLQYSTGNGNGPFGLGWQLSIPRITRKTEKGLPEYTDMDVFLMSGAEDLVRMLDEHGNPISVPDLAGCAITRYRPRTEGLFARIERWQNKDDPTDVHWRATTKENVTSIYGKSPSARLVDPDRPGHTFEWLLEETFDAKGNHTLYEYVQEDPNLSLPGIHERNRRYTQAYIRRILYGNTPDKLDAGKRAGPERTAAHHLDPTLNKARHYVFEVLFDYGDLPNPPPIYEESSTDTPWWDGINDDLSAVEPRPDPFSTFRSGFEIRTLRLCSRVLMLHHFKEGELIGAPLVRSTHFTYTQDPHAGFTILKGVTVWGHRKDPQDPSSYLSRDMPPVTFGYSEFEPQKQRYQSVTAEEGDLPPLSLNDPNAGLMDIFGDGMPDVVQSTPYGFHYWENRGDARLGRRRHPRRDIPAGITLDQPNVAVGDLGGDGLVDLVVEVPPISGFYEATPDGGWKSFKRIESMPTIDFSDPDVRLVDLTGDGLSDVLMTQDTHFLWFRSRGEAGYDHPRLLPRQHDLDAFPDVYFSDPAGRVRLADMTGDGLSDIVLVHDGRIDYWPNLGYCRWGKRITLGDTPRIGHDFDPRRLFLADLDGTGCVDLVYVDYNQVHFWFNLAGNGWSEKHTVHGTPYTVDTTALQFADFYGTGTTCLVWSYDYGSIAGGNYKVLDFCGSRKPHLLVEMSNNMGATTRAQYASSTKFYLEDKKNGQPWLTNLPFPVQVLEKSEVIDHISKTKLVTSYKYHHGYYDGREREFRGFGRVDQFDTEVFDEFVGASLHEGQDLFENNKKGFHVPPVETRTWYHTGIYFDPDRYLDHRELTQQYQREYYGEDSDAFELGGPVFQEADGTAGHGSLPHEAFRALRGAVLRSEVYARDGADKADHPYTVTENRYWTKELQARCTNPHAVYLTTPKESLTYLYERNPDDPRIGHTLTLAVDDYGNVTESVAIGYPRRRVPADLPEQGELKAVYSRTDFVNRDVPTTGTKMGYYYAGVPCQTRSYEVTGLEWQLGDSRLKDGAFPKHVRDDSADVDPNTFKGYEWQRTDADSGLIRRIIEWSRSYYRCDVEPDQIDDRDNQAHRLELGDIDLLGLPYESYQAALNEALLDQIYETRWQGIDLAGEGGYQEETDYWWIPSGRQAHDPDKFLAVNKAADAFGHVTKTAHDDYALLVTAVEDALPAPKTNVTQANNDYRVLQPCEVVDPNGSRTQVAFDALGLVVGTAVMGVDQAGDQVGDSLDGFVTELPDELRNRHLNDPLNRDPTYDTDPHHILKQATTRLVYDLKRFQDSLENGQSPVPNVVYTLAREAHYREGERQGVTARIQHRLVYSDGFCREIQTKIQAEPDRATPDQPRWVGTGTKIHNNKGQPVQQFEPFFSRTHDFGIEQHGVSSTLFYDSVERVICTVHPNHTYEKVVFAPWQQETWDANDTLLLRPHEDDDVKGHVEGFMKTYQHPLDGRPFKTWYDERIPDRDHKPAHPTSAQRAALISEAHAGTPTTAYLDTLGRPFLTIAHSGQDAQGEDILFRTHIELDIEGNDLKITDPRQYELNQERAAGSQVHNFVHQFDLAGRKLRVDSVDAGLQLAFVGVTQKLLYTWDGVGRRVQTIYDELRRPTELWVKEQDAGVFYLAQRTIYGEDKPEPHQTHHRLQVWKVYDGAGLASSEIYDFKGNLIRQGRQLLLDGKAQIQWPATGSQFDEAQAEALLQTKKYEVIFGFDALNRITLSRLPDGTIQELIYNEANLLDSLAVTLEGSKKTFIENIDYDEKGQRTRIRYGNGVETDYAYDPETFRLTGIITRRQGSNHPDLQLLSYVYDPVGNITSITDEAHQRVFNHNNIIEPVSKYLYDPLYRLVEATSREHEAMTPCHYRDNDRKFTETIRLTNQPTANGQALGNYVEEYEYDQAGNITSISHHNLTLDRHWRREQYYDPDSNRIKTSQAGCSEEHNFDLLSSHDENGTITALPHLSTMKWEFKNQLVEVQLNVGANPNIAYYQYDAGGRRARKMVVKNNRTEERLYLGGYEIYTEANGSGLSLRRDTIHVLDDNNRIALIDVKKDPADGTVQNTRTRYQLANHLGSSVLEVDETTEARIISYEEHYPYGGAAYLAGSSLTEVKKKRYRYSGKERDDETGLYYYGARYYAPWLGRWMSTDPAGLVDGPNIYAYAANNPIALNDPSGTQVFGDRDVVHQIGQLQAPLEVGRWWESDPKKNPHQWAHPLSSWEQGYFTAMSSEDVPEPIRMTDDWQMVDPNNLTAEQIKKAQALFGKGTDALQLFANYENRHRIVQHYTYTHPATVELQLGLYSFIRDINPIHFALERGWQVGSGEEMFTGKEVSRLGAAAEFFLALGIGWAVDKALAIARPTAGGRITPTSFDSPEIWASFRAAVRARAAHMRKILSNQQRGPVISGVLDLRTGRVSFGINQGEVIKNLHPILKQYYNNYMKSTGGVTPPRAGIPGSHSEIVALNNALYARQAALGRFVIDPEELSGFVVHNASLVRSNPLGVPGPCLNCQGILPPQVWFLP
jgi:RHS repeat-associated protein